MSDQEIEESFSRLRFAKAAVKPPVSHVPGNTTYFEAGPVRLGVEYRLVTEEVLAKFYGAERSARNVTDRFGNPVLPSDDSDDEGVSVHVFDAESGSEHLRFDNLDNNKHYHYLRADGRHAIVWFDEIAGGDYLPWVMSTLRTRIRPMLRLAGATELADRVDEHALDEALTQVETAARLKAAQRTN